MARIEERLAGNSAALCRDLALYLQVLREGLPQAAAQAVFHLATQVMPERYAALLPAERGELQDRLRELVRRCGSLLTLEQLVVLGRQVQAEGQRLQRREQQRLMAAMADAAGDSGPAGESPDAEDLPWGSIRLGLELPLSADLFGGGVPGLAGLGALTGPPTEAASEDDDAPEDQTNAGPPGAEEGPADLLQSLMAMAAASLGHLPEADDDGERPTSASTSTPSGLSPELHSVMAPRRPLDLLRWWESLDRSLERRLRNLSHAINLDLLRLGLTRGLLPVNLLEAVLRGQVEPMPAPPNLLRLGVPIGSEDLGGRMEVLGVLLRAADLEFEQPRLRSCRRRLQRRRQEVRRMAQHYRHWQRRARALEAERQWLQDSRHPTHRSTPPPPA
jgi:hypothetical protein